MILAITLIALFIAIIAFSLLLGKGEGREEIELAEIPQIWEDLFRKAPTQTDEEFLGRDKDIKRFLELSHQFHTLVITGEDGVGKTTLVANFSQSIPKEIPLLWITCTKETNYEDVFIFGNEFLLSIEDETFDHLLHNPNLDYDEKIRQLLSKLDIKRCLVVIDDFLASEDSHYLRIISRMIETFKTSQAFLVTSQDLPYNITPNQRQQVLSLEGLSTTDSVELLKAGGVTQDTTLLTSYAQIFKGNPLYLKLLRGLAKVYDLAEIFSDFETSGEEAGEKLIDLCLRTLRADEENVVAYLSCVNEPVSKSAIEAVYKKRNVAETLLFLVDKGLLLRHHENFFSLPIPIKTAFYNRLENKGYFHLKWGQFYRELARRVDQKSSRFALKSALHFIQAADHQRAFRILSPNIRTIISDGYPDKLRHILTKIDVSKLDERSTLKLSMAKIMTFTVLKMFDDAINECNQVIQLAKERNDTETLIQAYNYLGLSYQTQGDLENAVKFYEMSLKIPRQLKSAEGKIGIHHHWPIYIGKGEFNEAIRYYQSTRIKEEEEEVFGEEITTYLHLGVCYEKMGNPDRAIRYFRRGLDVSQEIKDTHGEILSHIHLASAFKEKNDPDRSIQHYESALELKAKIGDTMEQGEILKSLGNLYRMKNELAKAIGYFIKALESFQIERNLPMLSNCYIHLASAYEERGDYPRAIENYEKAMDLKVKLGEARDQAPLLQSLAKMYEQEGNIKQAIATYERSAAGYREAGNLVGWSSSYNSLGSIYLNRKDADRAITYFEEALGVAKKAEELPEEGKSLKGLALAYLLKDDQLRAIEFFNQALEVFRHTSDLPNLQVCYQHLKGLYSAQGELEKSRVCEEKLERIRTRQKMTATAF